MVASTEAFHHIQIQVALLSTVTMASVQHGAHQAAVMDLVQHLLGETHLTRSVLAQDGAANSLTLKNTLSSERVFLFVRPISGLRAVDELFTKSIHADREIKILPNWLGASVYTVKISVIIHERTT